MNIIDRLALIGVQLGVASLKIHRFILPCQFIYASLSRAPHKKMLKYSYESGNVR